MSIVTVVGNPRPGSRTLGVATALATAVAARSGDGDLLALAGRWATDHGPVLTATAGALAAA